MLLLNGNQSSLLAIKFVANHGALLADDKKKKKIEFTTVNDIIIR